MKKNLPVTGKAVHLKDDETIISTTDLKGAITYVNRAFIETSGFNEDELIGKNHNVIRHPDMPPAAFEDLWDTVKSGVPWRGLVKNRCKNGDHYWVEAFVSPVKDNGKTVGYQSVRNKASSEQVREAEVLYKQINQGQVSKIPKPFRLADQPFFSRMVFLFIAAGLLPLIGNGLEHFSIISGSAVLGLDILTLLILVSSLVYIKQYMINPLKTAINLSEKMAAGSLKQQIQVDSNDEIGQLLRSLKIVQARFNTVIGQLSEDAYSVLVTGEHLNLTSSSSYQQMMQQMSDTSSASASISELSASVQEIAQNTETTSAATETAAGEAENGKQLVNQLGNTVERLVVEVGNSSAVIGQLHVKSQDITNIIKTISAIAEQTNLLALNTAIEAARAGEQGRGFAVVADEVRSLATRTQEATAEINRVIEDLQSGISDAVSVMEKGQQQAGVASEQSENTLASLNTISEEIAEINMMTSQVATTATQQAAVSVSVSQNVQDIASMTSKTISMSQANSETSNQLSHSAKSMLQHFSFFDVADDYDEAVSKAVEKARHEYETGGKVPNASKNEDVELF